MSGAIAKYSGEFNLKTDIDVSGLTEEQISALRQRLVKSNISVASDSAMKQIRLDAATVEADNAIASAIKLEQTSADYKVDAETQSGSARTTISMSSKGDANYRNLLFTIVIILAIVGLIAYIVFGPKSKSRSSYRSNGSYQKSGSYPSRSSQPYRYPNSRKNNGY